MKMYDGIVLDVDDTLLVDGKLHTEDVQYIQKLEKMGIKVVIATGRTLQSVLPIIEKLELKTPFILLQGSLIYYNQNRVLETPLNDGIIRDIMEWCTNNDVVASAITKEHSQFFSLKQSTNQKKIFSDILQINVDFQNQQIKKKIFEKEFEPREDIIIRVHPDSLVCMSIDTDKGVGIRRIACENGWDLSRFISIGNYPSDSMLFDETGFNIVIERKKKSNIINDSNIQIVTEKRVCSILKEVFKELNKYTDEKYSKNLKSRIRSIGGDYYIIKEAEVRLTTKTAYILWKAIGLEKELSQIIRDVIVDRKFYDVIKELDFLIKNEVIIKSKKTEKLVN
jgi:HAD superfamily hydrolase (TIGR01484 family)